MPIHLGCCTILHHILEVYIASKKNYSTIIEKLLENGLRNFFSVEITKKVILVPSYHFINKMNNT